MIRGIPNQPLDFVGDDILGCDEQQAPLDIASEDSIIFQFTLGRCSDATEYIGDPDFADNWKEFGDWERFPNSMCAGNGQAGAQTEYDGWTSVVSQIYEVEIVVYSISGSGATVTIGGDEYLIQSVGTHTFMSTVAVASGLVITLVDDTSAICMSSAQVYAANTSVEIQFRNESGDTLDSFDILSSPQYFEINGTTVIIRVPVDQLTLEECFKVFIVDGCSSTYGYDDGELCSQTLVLDKNCDTTIKLRVCNDSDQPGMGFVAGYFEARFKAKVILPKYSYDVEEERLSNGYINRHYIDRQSSRQLTFNNAALGTSAHAFLSSIPVFDHFYIGELEYSVDVEDYEPSYPDTSATLGAVKMTIRPKQELFRKVLCEPIGVGCNPVNDPICDIPRIRIDQTIIGEQIYLQVNLYSLVGFVFTGLYATVNGVQGPFSPYPSPTVAVLGPYITDDVVVVTVVNADDPECNYVSEEMVIGEDPSFSAGGLNDEVFALQFVGDGLVVGGNFTLFSATTANRFTKLLLTGALDTDFNTNMGSGFDAAVQELALDLDGNLVVVGLFSNVDGNAYSHIAKIGTDGTPDLTFSVGTGFNNTFTTDVDILPSGSYIITGNFTSYDGTTANSIIALLPTGAIDTSFVYGSGFNSTTGRVVYDPFTDTILVSGNSFTTYDGNTVRFGVATIVRINLDGTFNSVVATHTDGTDPQFNAGIRGLSVMADGRIVVTGDFTIYDGTAVGHIAVLNTDGTLDTAFMSNMGSAFSDWTTRSKVQFDGKVMVGVYNATTTTFDGSDANGMIRLESTGARDLTFNTGVGFNGRTGPSDEDGTDAYVGGNFTQLNSAARLKVARLPFP